MPDQNDEPQRRRRPDAEPGNARPTRDARPDFGLGPDLDGPGTAGNLEPLRTPPQGDGADRARASEPELRRADRDTSRQRAGSVGIPDELRGYLDRLGNIEDEISDAEAARRAGLTTDLGDEPEPPEYQDLPAVIRNDLATLGGELAAAGEQYPEWHTINNLPGYMKNAIRAMGRGNFRMFTRTDLEDIITIANLGGKGPNTEAEVKAVAGWLVQNAENLGPVDIDYSEIMPGYEPEVVEFRTAKTRFHVVRDPGGVYIYAYPEKDAIDRTGQGRLEGPSGSSDDDERDEFGAKIKRISKESKMENKFNSVSEQIRYYTNVLESLQLEAAEEQQQQEELAVWENYDVDLNEASSLRNLLGDQPGGKELAIELHRKLGLASGAGKKNRPDRPSITPNYVLVPDRLSASAIKASQDNFAIVLGQNGSAAIKTTKNRADNTTSYQIVWALPGEPASSETNDYRLGLRTGGGGTSGMKAGAPNIFQILIQKIGRIKDIYITTDAVERLKQKTRAEYNKPEVADKYQVTEKMVNRLKPVLLKLLNSAVGNIQQRAAKMSQAGNFTQSQELSAAGAKIQEMLTALDTDTPNYNQRPLTRFYNLVKQSIENILDGKNEEEKNQTMVNMARGQGAELGAVLDAVRSGLYKIHNVDDYRY